MSDEHFTVPWTPTEAMWGGLARALMMWLDMGDKTPRALFQHLARSGEEIPQWLKDEPEMQMLNHVPSKGTRCAIIYRAMLEACRREGLRQMVANDEGMGLYDERPLCDICGGTHSGGSCDGPPLPSRPLPHTPYA